MSVNDGVSYRNIVNKVYEYGYSREDVLLHIVTDNERVIQFGNSVAFLTESKTWTLQAVIEYFNIICPVVGIETISNGFQIKFGTRIEADTVVKVYEVMNNEKYTKQLRKMYANKF